MDHCGVRAEGKFRISTTVIARSQLVRPSLSTWGIVLLACMRMKCTCNYNQLAEKCFYSLSYL